MSWIDILAIAGFAIGWAVLLGILNALFQIAHNLKLIHSVLDLMRAEHWQRHTQVYGSMGGMEVKGRRL